MPFQRGNTLGNRKGRPKKGDSLADLVRSEGGKAGKLKMVRRMWTLSSEPHDRPDIAIKAAEWCAKHGWPHEQKPDFNLSLPDAKAVTIIHEHVD